ncbi:MAG: hypothetical protein ACRCUY_10960 [Thermoguttaceae bacterium]
MAFPESRRLSGTWNASVFWNEFRCQNKPADSCRRLAKINPPNKPAKHGTPNLNTNLTRTSKRTKGAY